MRRLLATVLLLAAAVAGAQEGFPLDGTWRGERQDVGKGAGKAPVTIVMVMQWDGQKVTGVINPGPQAIQIAAARLIPDGWRVTIAARTADGKPIAFDGVLADLGAYNRKIDGTWTEGGHSYQVRMVRE
jgi:hypothetical protein